MPPTRQATPTTNETAMRTTWWPFAGVVWPKMEGRFPAGTARYTMPRMMPRTPMMASTSAIGRLLGWPPALLTELT